MTSAINIADTDVKIHADIRGCQSGCGAPIHLYSIATYCYLASNNTLQVTPHNSGVFIRYNSTKLLGTKVTNVT